MVLLPPPAVALSNDGTKAPGRTPGGGLDGLAGLFLRGRELADHLQLLLPAKKLLLFTKPRLLANGLEERGVELVARTGPAQLPCHAQRGSTAEKGVENRLPGKGEHADQPARKLTRKNGDMVLLPGAREGPVAVEILVPLLRAQAGELLLRGIRPRSLPQLLEQQDVLVIELHDTVAGIGKGAHDHPAPGGVHGRHLLPDDRAHEVETPVDAAANDVGVDRRDPVPAVGLGAKELVADIDRQPAARVERPLAFTPDPVKLADVLIVFLVEADLVLGLVVLQLPVGRRGHHQVYRAILDVGHRARVSQHHPVAQSVRLLALPADHVLSPPSATAPPARAREFPRALRRCGQC